MQTQFKPFARLDLPDLRPAKELGPAPELRWMPIEKLVIDEAYQRPLGRDGLANIAQIAELFDWRKFGPVVISPVEGGLYAVVDGQHRTHGALLCGASVVPCLVIQANSREQAQAFAAINGSVTKIQRVSLMKAQLAAGDPDLNRLEGLAGECGLSIVWHLAALPMMQPTQSCAVNPLLRLMKRDASLFCQTVKAILLCKREPQSNVSAFWLEVFANVLDDHKEWWNEALLTAALSPIGLAAQLKRITELKRGNANINRKSWAESIIIEKLAAAAKKRTAA